MSSHDTYVNPWGWPTPLTDAILHDSMYQPFSDPAQNLAERLVWLGNVAFNTFVWGPTSGRADSYWGAYADRVVACTLMAGDVAEWWEKLMETLPGVPLTDSALLHEKNLLVHPSTLAPVPVPDVDVLTVLRTYPLDLTDRVRATLRLRGTKTRAQRGDR